MNLVRLLSLALLLSAAQQVPAALAQEPTSVPSTTADDSVAAITEGLKESMLAMTKDMHGIVSEIEMIDPDASTVETADFDADEISESMIELNEEMYEIISSIRSVEDVRAADERIGEIFEELVETLRSGMQNPTEMQKLEMKVQQDPKMQE